LMQFFGFDGTGKLLADCYSPASAAVLRRRMMMSIENDLPVRVAGVTDLVDTDMPRTYEGIWLAILDEDDAAVHALAAFDTGYGLTPADEARHAEAENVDAIEYPDT
jgi:hypothetical protein